MKDFTFVLTPSSNITDIVPLWYRIDGECEFREIDYRKNLGEFLQKGRCYDIIPSHTRHVICYHGDGNYLNKTVTEASVPPLHDCDARWPQMKQAIKFWNSCPNI